MGRKLTELNQDLSEIVWMSGVLPKAGITDSLWLVLVCSLEAVLLYIAQSLHNNTYGEADNCDDIRSFTKRWLSILVHLG